MVFVKRHSSKMSHKPPAKQSRNWCATIYGENMEELVPKVQAFAEAHCKQYAFQQEVCPTTNKPHLQCVFVFAAPKVFSTVKNKLNFGVPPHIETCKRLKESLMYCTKHDTRVAGPWTKGVLPSQMAPEPIEDPLQGQAPFHWQEQVLHLIQQKPHPRKIYWIHEPTGQTGKTSLAKHICLKYPALYVSGAGKDILCGVQRCIELKFTPKVVLFDIPRCSQGHVSYASIEQVKNGIFFSGKYESTQVLFNVPHVIILSNEPPDTSMLSQDRWSIHMIDPEEENRVLNPEIYDL